MNNSARRLVFLFLVLCTMTGLTVWLAVVFSADGFTGFEIAMIILFAANTPWLAIGLWNAVIGFLILQRDPDWLTTVLPIDGLAQGAVPITSRNAIIMPVFNEDPDRVLRHLRTVKRSIDATGQAGAFAFFLLSDTNRPEIAAREKQLFAAWQAGEPDPERMHYRRRPTNPRRKVGNIEDFCEHWGSGFDHFVILDADSVMTGDAILRLVRLMQANPSIGILQSLVCGLPADSAFARIFQFGMRHGMRVYTVGGAWWQGDEGPYWGHNAIVKLAPFRAHCRLPRLAGSGPLGGEILSHDQVEAVLMRRAGYQVRVLPEEGGSYEENPPTLQDFLKRDLRWCQGNLQYLKLLGMPGIRRLGRLQLLLAIMMYTGAPFWYGFMFIGLAQFAWYFEDGPIVFDGEVGGSAAAAETLPMGGIVLFTVILTLLFAPKILGLVDVCLRPIERARYGGRLAIVLSGFLELVFGMLLAPVVALAQTRFIIGLFFGRRVGWDPQARERRHVSLGEAFADLWPQTLTGCLFAAGLWTFAPDFLVWGLPVIVGLVLSVPFASILSWGSVGRVCKRWGVCTVPEECDPPPELAWMGFDVRRSSFSLPDTAGDKNLVQETGGDI